ncbi:MAG: hypothetical protein M3081_09425 [Gemmatimonadota bacterium]|nr:hypothetical protein [Gemmatimonadota bacterium]
MRDATPELRALARRVEITRRALRDVYDESVADRGDAREVETNKPAEPDAEPTTPPAGDERE